MPLVDVNAAVDVAREALQLGCKALVIPSRCPAHHSPSHIGFDSLWALAQEAGVPILFHVGGEEKMAPAYFENGLPRVKDFHGGDENFTAASFLYSIGGMFSYNSMIGPVSMDFTGVGGTGNNKLHFYFGLGLFMPVSN